MALSASTNFSVTRDQLINDAFHLIGVGSDGETLQNSDLQRGVRYLNMLIKSWMPDGMVLAIRKTTSITLVASDADYTIGPSGNKVIDRPFRVTQCWKRDSDSNDTEVEIISQSTYNSITTKSQTSSGGPTQVFYDKTLTNGTLYVWPVPDSTAATEYTLHIEYQKPYDDMDAATNDFEFEQDAYLAIMYGLAAILSDAYGLSPTERAMLKKDAKTFKDDFLSGNVSQESIFFQYEDGQ